jgi:subtilisin
MTTMTPPDVADVLAARGDGVRVLVVDSGVEITHPALATDGAAAPVSCFHLRPGADGRLAVAPDPAGGDTFGHGTAVAGIVRAHAPAATLHSLRVLGGDLRASSDAILTGLAWAVEQAYDVVNCSFGTTSSVYLGDYKWIVDRAFCRNVILVSACSNADFRQTWYPASFPSVLSTDFGRVEGLRLKRRTGQLVEFVARGEGVEVAWKGGGYRTNTGSSFAAPHLACLAVKLRQLRPDWNVCQMKAYLYGIAAST